MLQAVTSGGAVMADARASSEGSTDVFTEEFPRFLFPDEKLKNVFLELHGELCTAEFWRKKQQQLEAGQEDDVVPYLESRRFPHAHG